MRGVIGMGLALALLAGGGWWAWQHYVDAAGTEGEGSGLEAFGQAGHAAIETAVRTEAAEDGTRQVAVWTRSAQAGERMMELVGQLRYADEPVVRTDFRGRRAMAAWAEEGELGGRVFRIEGEWVEAAATTEGLGLEMRVSRTVRWGEKAITVEGQGRATASADGTSGVYVERAVVAGVPVVTTVRYESKPSGAAVDITWTRRTQVGEKGSVYENTGSYAGPALPLPVVLAPYELMMLLAAEGGK